MNLTTAARFKTFAGITGIGQDTLIGRLIAGVSDEIARMFGCDIVETTYKTWVDGKCGKLLRLKHWPVSALYQVSINAINVARVYNNSASVSRATVSFDGTNLMLNEISVTGTETLTSKPVATSKIMSTMETAVEAVSGWSMTVESDYVSEPTSFLRPLYGQAALHPDQADLYIPDDPVAAKLISDDCIELTMNEFPEGTATVFLWYKAGYSLPADTGTWTFPDGFEMVVQQIINDALNGIKVNSNLTSESLGDYSYSRAQILSAIENRRKDLVRYMRKTVIG